MMTEKIQPLLMQSPLGLLFDIDGTLSPIAPTPDEARLYTGVEKLLRQASAYAHVGIITGRAVKDGARLVDVDGLTYIGTHGLEWSDGLPETHPIQLLPEALPYVEPGKELLDLVESHLTEFPGVIVQRKNVGGSIHYRLAPEPEQTRERLLALLREPAQRLQMRLGEGKRVVEVLAPLKINKGHALRRYVNHFGLRSVLFAGDDRTDLDAILEIETLRQEGYTALSIVVQHQDTLPALLEHGDIIVQEVEGMVQLFERIVAGLHQQEKA
ncbi:trehalose-phosphatase [Tengunoibacter tsumagoiensis]|uniref:Trehalose 6-phosphate phosphatase n=1 Tax=Tengunoibacter tsumagoiensis TaxID=2014871 RepID=A0A401ZWF2_9CHLR|nr:trehalose-phosphatase [Tengunoibacter tsumagoiensis]GCE11132.1 trehalose-phosphatase [Tengunoibacter tsumagoiensis]